MGVGGIHLGVACILLGDIRLGVGYFLLGLGLIRGLVDILRGRERPSIHLVVEPPEGLQGQARSTLPVQVFSLLEVDLRGPALVSFLQGLVHQVLMDQVPMDQVPAAQVQMDLVQVDQVPTVPVPMAQARTDQVPTVLVPTVQAQTVLAQTDQVHMGLDRMAQARMARARMVLVRMAQGPTVQARMDLAVEAGVKSQRSSPARNMSAQLRLRLHHAALHLKPSWQNAPSVERRMAMPRALSLEDLIAHSALLARFALSPKRTLCKYQALIRFVEKKSANISPAPAQAQQQSRSPMPQPQVPSIIATALQL